MNIVKIKDIILDTTSGLTESQCDLFNSKFRGKYVHAVDWTFCIPLEDITNEEVVRLSREFCSFSKAEETKPTEQSPLYSLAPEVGNWNICTSLPSDLSKYEFLISYCKGDGSGAIVRGFNTTYLDVEKVSEGFSGSMVEGNGKSLKLVAPALSMVFKIEAGVENKYYIYHEVEGEDGEVTKMYLGNNSSGNILYGEKSNDSLWDLNFLDLSSNGSVTMTCGSSSKNILMYNTSSPRMKCYAESSASTSSSMKMDISLYMRLAEIPKEEPVLYFDVEEIRTYLGEKIISTPIYNPFGVSLTYTSDNTDVAIVEEDGTVRLVGVGECNIICTSEETDIYTSVETSYHLVVRADKVDSEYSFTIQDSDISCEVGDVLVNPAVTPYDDVEYQETHYVSDDPSVATVNEEGIVNIKKEGIAEIHFLGIESEKYNDTDIYYTIQATYNPIREYDWLLYDLLIPYIEVEITEDINNVNKYICLNKFVSDDDITIDELKSFRTWLADNVLYLSSELDDKTTHMLNYYVNEMDDDVCKYLQMFGTSNIQFLSTSSGCGCNKTSGYTSISPTIAQTVPTKHVCGCGDNSSLYNLGNVNLCDPLVVYRKNIYTKMVEVFSNIEFWLQFDKDFISEFKKYIDNIVRANFTLTTSEYISSYVDCNCLSEKDLEQKKNVEILNNLSKSLEFISNEDVVGHKNFINESLLSWSSMLYEKMRW